MRNTILTACLLAAAFVLFYDASASTDPMHRLLTLIDEQEALPPLFPLYPQDYLGFGCAILGLLLAAGGGIGGGGILVPVYILVLDFPVKHAIPLASATVFGGAIANNLLNFSKRHPLHSRRPLIDWDLILQMEPMTMAGALLGVELNELLPEAVLMVLLLVLLSLTAYNTLSKACIMYRAESEALKDLAAAPHEGETLMVDNEYDDKEDVETSSSTHYGATDVELSPSQSSIESFDESTTSYKLKTLCDVLKLTSLFAVITSINLLKGGAEAGGGPLGLQSCDDKCFWISEVIILLTILAFSVAVRSSLLHRLESGGPVTSDIDWNRSNTITYPALAVTAGLVAGMFGVGGGIVKGPLMIALGVHPAVSSATSAAMILFTSSVACLSYSITGKLVYDYAAVCLLIGFFSTLAGQLIMHALMRGRRNSYIAFSIGIVVALSAVCMSIESFFAIEEESEGSS